MNQAQVWTERGLELDPDEAVQRAVMAATRSSIARARVIGSAAQAQTEEKPVRFRHSPATVNRLRAEVRSPTPRRWSSPRGARCRACRRRRDHRPCRPVELELWLGGEGFVRLSTGFQGGVDPFHHSYPIATATNGGALVSIEAEVRSRPSSFSKAP